LEGTLKKVVHKFNKVSRSSQVSSDRSSCLLCVHRI